MLPQRGSVYSREGRRQRTKVTTFDHARKRGQFELQTASKVQKDVALDVATQDLLSAIYALRTIAPKPGESFAMPVSDSGKLYQVSGRSVNPKRSRPRLASRAGATRHAAHL